MVLATKVGLPMGEGPNQRGASRRWITTAVENSLHRLGTDHIDVYQLQRPDPDTDLEETLSVLTDLVRAGKVRAIGSSTTPASVIVQAQWAAEHAGLQRFRTEQPPYSILNRGIEREVLPLAQEYGMGVMVWGPFGQGLLTGRVRKGGDNDLKRVQFSRHLSDERRISVVEQLVPLAKEAGLPMTHLAMAFTIAHPGVSAALLGPRTMEHLDDLLAGADVELSDDLLDRIDEIVPPGTDVTALDQEYRPPALLETALRRRPAGSGRRPEPQGPGAVCPGTWSGPWHTAGRRTHSYTDRTGPAPVPSTGWEPEDTLPHLAERATRPTDTFPDAAGPRTRRPPGSGRS